MRHEPASAGGDAAAIRRRIRAGAIAGHTSGLAPKYVQGNVVILPAALAADFRRFCDRNPKPCPLLAVSEAGQPTLPSLGKDLDIRTDIPRYRIWRDGTLVEEPIDISAYCRDDLVTFVLGCSFTFEQALLDAGIALRHISLGLNVAMYRTSIPTEPSGPFHGPLVVSMRPLTPTDAIRATEITSGFPLTHGAPVHIGKPELIGIADLSRPDYGDPVPMAADEVPVFWACTLDPDGRYNSQIRSWLATFKSFRVGL